MDKKKIESIANAVTTWITISAPRDVRSIQRSVNNGDFGLKDHQYRISEENALNGIFEFTLLYLYLSDMYYLTQRADADRLLIIKEVQKKIFSMMANEQVSMDEIINVYTTRTKFFYQYQTLINTSEQGPAGSLFWEVGDILMKKMTNSEEAVSPFLIQVLQTVAVASLGQLAALKIL